MPMVGEIEPGVLRATVPDGATVAIGGAGLNRKPMGLVRSLVESGARDLTVVSFLGSVDVEVLLAAGIVAEVHTAGSSLDSAGLAPRFRAARQEGSPPVVEWSEGSLAAALEAAARGVDSMPCTTSPLSQILEVNPWLAVDADPFTRRPSTYARALVPDVALIQGSVVDDAGNLHVDGDPAIDGLIARAAGTVIASALANEARPGRHASISRIWIDRVVIDPASAWPTACHPGEPADLATVQAWAASGGGDLTILDPPEMAA